MAHGLTSVCKAGQLTTVESRPSILAAANPRHGNWRTNLFLENISIPARLLSKFDIVVIMLSDESTDVTKHILYQNSQMHQYEVKTSFDSLEERLQCSGKQTLTADIVAA